MAGYHWERVGTHQHGTNKTREVPMKLEVIRSRKIHRIRHMQHMLYLAKRAKREAGGKSELLDFHIANYEKLLQFVQDAPE